MTKPGKCVNSFVVSIFIVGFVLCLTPFNARADIDELNIGIGVDADTLNPHEQSTSLSINICELIYDTLFFQAPGGRLKPRLATKYEVSQDRLNYTIHLRKGVRFSDGTPFNANSMKLNLDRALNPKLRAPLRFTLGMIEEVRVVDEYSIRIRIKYPFAPFASTLSMAILSPISPAAIKKYKGDVRRHPVGAGPYVLREWVKGERIVLVRNRAYFGPRPTVKKIIFKIIPEAATRESMLSAGKIDICYKPSQAHVKALEADQNITVEMPLNTRTIIIGLNFKKGVTKNKRVRQAFNYAVNKKEIVKKILFNMAIPMEGPTSPILFGFHKMAHQYDYNPSKAKELLKKANFDFSRTIHIRTSQGRYPFDKQVSEAIQVYLRAIGVKAELRIYDWTTYVADLLQPIDKTELEIFYLAWGPMVLDADMSLYGQFHSSMNPPEGLGASHYSNQEYDKLIQATRLEHDPDKRLALFKKASEIVWDDCPWIWLYVEKFVIAYRSDLKGLVVTGTEKFYPTYMKRRQ